MKERIPEKADIVLVTGRMRDVFDTHDSCSPWACGPTVCAPLSSPCLPGCMPACTPALVPPSPRPSPKPNPRPN